MSEIENMWKLLNDSNAETMELKMFKNKGDEKPFRMIVFIEGEAACAEVQKFLDNREKGETARFRIDIEKP